MCKNREEGLEDFLSFDITVYLHSRGRGEPCSWGFWLQFLITCSMQKWEGLRDLIMCNDLNHTQGRHMGEQCPTVIIYKLCFDLPQMYQTMRCIDASFQTFQSPFQERTLISFVGHCPLCVSTYHYITSPHMMQYLQVASLLRHCKL